MLLIGKYVSGSVQLRKDKFWLPRSTTYRLLSPSRWFAHIGPGLGYRSCIILRVSLMSGIIPWTLAGSLHFGSGCVLTLLPMGISSRGRPQTACRSDCWNQLRKDLKMVLLGKPRRWRLNRGMAVVYGVRSTVYSILAYTRAQNYGYPLLPEQWVFPNAAQSRRLNLLMHIIY